jgi:hypothetical protein
LNPKLTNVIFINMKAKALSHDLFNFLASVTQDMALEYERIQKRATEDPGTAGDQGEENWASLLRNWLPPTYQVVTKGRILGHQGIASPQVDVVVLHPTYPRQLLDKKLYLAGGVAAAFECKLTLRAEHIGSAIKNAVEIRRILMPRTGTPYKELNTSIIYGLLAHAHIWKGKNSSPMHNISKGLESWRSAGVQHPRELLDFLCIANYGTYVLQKQPFELGLEKSYGSRGPVGTGYMQYVPFKYLPEAFKDTVAPEHRDAKPSFEPIGTLLCYLLHKLAWEDLSLRPLAEYFHLAEVEGVGGGRLIGWPLNIYSEEVRDRILSNVSSKYDPWNEWSRILM